MKMVDYMRVVLLTIFVISSGYFFENVVSARENLSENRSFSVVTYNISAGSLLNKNTNKNQLINYLAQSRANIIGLNEVDRETMRSKGIDQVSMISTALDYKFAFSKSLDYQNGQYGNALLSNDIEKYNTVLLYNEESCEQRSLIQSAISIQGKKINVLVAHLEYSNKKVRAKQIEQISGIIHNIKGPIILMGDFNVESVEELQIFTDKLSSIYGSNEPITYPETNATLDFIFFSNELVLNKWNIRKLDISDHYPVEAEFILI